jgi:hypothetical protein
MTVPAIPRRGDFVRVRTRRWLVEGEYSAGEVLTRFARPVWTTMLRVRWSRSCGT